MLAGEAVDNRVVCGPGVGCTGVFGAGVSDPEFADQFSWNPLPVCDPSLLNCTYMGPWIVEELGGKFPQYLPT